jgi:SPP1 gp7 family putative phage head morphogenesis protein
MRELLVGEDGIKSWPEFRDAAGEIFETYNNRWLRAEFDTAIGQGQNAVHWNNIEKNKELLPYLKYNATEDERECEICAPFNDLTAPVDDPIWNTVFPANHYLCRCTVDQIDKYESPALTSEEDKESLIAGAKEKMNPVFQSNPGKDKMIFNQDHPYFKEVPEKDKGFAKENFGLDIPDPK